MTCRVYAQQMGLHTSKRMHFIEDENNKLGFVHFTVLHTSKRMHFIEESHIAWKGCI